MHVLRAINEILLLKLEKLLLVKDTKRELSKNTDKVIAGHEVGEKVTVSAIRYAPQLPNSLAPRMSNALSVAFCRSHIWEP